MSIPSGYSPILLSSVAICTLMTSDNVKNKINVARNIYCSIYIISFYICGGFSNWYVSLLHFGSAESEEGHL